MMCWSYLDDRAGLTVYGIASAAAYALSSSGRGLFDWFFLEPCTVRQLWMVIDPAGPGRYTSLERSSFSTSSSDKHPTHAPSSLYWSNNGPR